MVTVINNPSAPNDSSSVGVIVGVILGILLIVLFFAYGLPILRSENTTVPTSSEQAGSVNLNLTLPEEGGRGSGSADETAPAPSVSQ